MGTHLRPDTCINILYCPRPRRGVYRERHVSESDRRCGPLPDKLVASTDRNGRQLKLKVLQEALAHVISPLNTQVWSGFQATAGTKVWNCHPVIALYCCDIPEGKDMSGVQHGGRVCPCVRCLIKKSDFLYCLLQKIGLEQVWIINKSRLNNSKQIANILKT